MYKIRLQPQDKTPKYKQLVQAVILDIEQGVLKSGEQLPSISEVSMGLDVARDTVEKAYRELRERGFITSVQGKGYYAQPNGPQKIKILLIFNKLSSYKKAIYYAFLEAVGDAAAVDLQIHHYDAQVFQEIIDQNLGKYQYYVVMPHFALGTSQEAYYSVLHKIPAQQLVLLDKDLPDLPHKCLRVFQDFNEDIFQALEKLREKLANYSQLVLLLPSDANQPEELSWGFRRYCELHHLEFSIIDSATQEEPVKGRAYVVIRETDLVELVKKTRLTGLQLGHDVGILSFNDTSLKELLGITVISTDFAAMGRTAATLLLQQQITTVSNPFYTIQRGSL
ncbi:GntR family transcriptional regulator [Hymenobacter tenuis]